MCRALGYDQACVSCPKRCPIQSPPAFPSARRFKILTKDPPTKTIAKTDTFAFNNKFTDKQRRIKVGGSAAAGGGRYRGRGLLQYGGGGGQGAAGDVMGSASATKRRIVVFKSDSCLDSPSPVMTLPSPLTAPPPCRSPCPLWTTRRR